MRRVYSSSNLVLVGQLRQLLAENQIVSFIKNEHLAGGVGELPIFECWPELWVTVPALADKARVLIEAFEGDAHSAARHKPWDCPKCTESIDANFGSCWNCGADRPTARQANDADDASHQL